MQNADYLLILFYGCDYRNQIVAIIMPLKFFCIIIVIILIQKTLVFALPRLVFAYIVDNTAIFVDPFFVDLGFMEHIV